MRHREQHRSTRIGWLRAAVLGANDGIVSTASLVVGVAAAEANPQQILVAGVAGLVAGALSMAAGEYVSVSSQADTEQADLARETGELADAAAGRGGRAHGHLRAARPGAGACADGRAAADGEGRARRARARRARTDRGARGRPLQAALASAATFAVGAAVPILTVVLAPASRLSLVVSIGLADLSGCARCDRGTGRRRIGRERRHARRVLGRTRYGDDGGHRMVVRNHGGVNAGWAWSLSPDART